MDSKSPEQPWIIDQYKMVELFFFWGKSTSPRVRVNQFLFRWEDIPRHGMDLCVFLVSYVNSYGVV